MPLDINQNDSWKGNSSDNDSDVTSIKSVHIASNSFLQNSTSSSYVCKLTHKRKKSKRCEPEVMISAGILPKRTKVMKNETQSRRVQVCIVYKNKQFNLFLIVYNNNI